MTPIFLGFQKCIANEDRDIENINEKLLNFIGFTKEDISILYNNKFSSLINDTVLNEVNNKIKTALEQKSSYSADYLIKTKYNVLNKIHEDGIIINENGIDKVYFNLCSYQIDSDIELFYKNLLNSLNEVIFITDLNKTLLYINDACSKLYKIDPLNSVGKPCSICQTKLCGTEQCNIECLKRSELSSYISYIDDFNGLSLRISTTYLYDARGNKIGYTSSTADISDLKAIETQLRISDERFRIAIPYTNFGIWEYDPAENTLIRETAADLNLNFPVISHNIPESMIKSGLIHEDSIEETRHIFKSLDEGAQNIESEIKIYTKAGSVRWYKISFTNIFDKDGKPLKAIGVTSDITDTKKTEMRYQQEREYLNSILADSLSIYEINLSKNKIERINSKSTPLPRKTDEDICCSLLSSAKEWSILAIDRGLIRQSFHRNELLHAFSKGITEVTAEYRCVNESKEYWVRTVARIIQPNKDDDIYAFITVRNINSQKQYEEELNLKASTDPLTGLYNRLSGVDKTSKILSSRQNNILCTLFMIDVDNFKLINDKYGHIFGDDFLIDFAKNLKLVFRKDDIICRLGGDEFFVFISNINPSLVMQKAELLCRQVRRMCENIEFEPSVSIGISFSTDKNDTFNDLYRKADLALYSAKNKGKNNFVIYDESLETNNN